MPKKPKSYDDLLRGQQPAGEASDWDWPERAAARRRAELTPAQKATLKRQEAATDRFVKRRLKKESIMKTLRRVVLEQNGKPRLKGKTPEERAKRAEILKKTLQTKADRNARAARTGGSGTSRPGYSSVDDSVAPLTSDRVSLFEATRRRRVPGTGPHIPASDRPGAAEKIIKDKQSGKRPQTPPKKRVKPGNVKRRDGSSVTTDEFGGKTEWGK